MSTPTGIGSRLLIAGGAGATSFLVAIALGWVLGTEPPQPPPEPVPVTVTVTVTDDVNSTSATTQSPTTTTPTTTTPTTTTPTASESSTAADTGSSPGESQDGAPGIPPAQDSPDPEPEWPS